jgi:hypothetical protein
MPHLVKLNLLDFTGYFLLRQLSAGFNYPAIYKRRPCIEYFREHIEGTFTKRIENHAHCFLGSNFLVCTRVAFNEIVPALLAFVPLLPTNLSALDSPFAVAILTLRHDNTIFRFDGIIISHIYLNVKTLKKSSLLMICQALFEKE